MPNLFRSGDYPKKLFAVLQRPKGPLDQTRRHAQGERVYKQTLL